MHRKITDHNDFPDMAALNKAARHKLVEEIEGNGMDEGRVFLRLVPGYMFDRYQTTSKSVGNAEEIAHALSIIVPKQDD